MFDFLILYIKSIDSNFFTIFILSMLPITELRGSIPYGILILKIHWINVFLLSVLGNIIIGLIIIYIIGPIMKLLMKLNFFNNIIQYIFKRTKNKGSIINSRRFYGLIVFVAIPFPLTGVWTGSLAAYLFDLSKSKTIIAIVLGVFLSGTIVTILSLFGFFVIS